MKRDEVALKILCALISNPERYKYIASQIEDRKLTQEQATAKNVNKAILIADAFIKESKNL